MTDVDTYTLISVIAAGVSIGIVAAPLLGPALMLILLSPVALMVAIGYGLARFVRGFFPDRHEDLPRKLPWAGLPQQGPDQWEGVNGSRSEAQ